MKQKHWPLFNSSNCSFMAMIEHPAEVTSPLFCPRSQDAPSRVLNDEGLTFEDDGSEHSSDSGLADILD